MLLATGLITGQALIGVLIAAIAAFVMLLPLMTSIAPAGILGVIALPGVIFYQYRQSLSAS